MAKSIPAWAKFVVMGCYEGEDEEFPIQYFKDRESAEECAYDYEAQHDGIVRTFVKAVKHKAPAKPAVKKAVVKPAKKPTAHSKRVSSPAVPSCNSNYLRVWYASAFPEDDLGKSIAPRATFDGLRKVLLGHHDGKDVYEYIGVGDSIIRERLFDELARRLGTSYDYVFNLWLKS